MLYNILILVIQLAQSKHEHTIKIHYYKRALDSFSHSYDYSLKPKIANHFLSTPIYKLANIRSIGNPGCFWLIIRVISEPRPMSMHVIGPGCY